tara:strand:- start:44 stop:493 length:450 start_codon:yes stop_codon:yes gene_type:complete
MPIKSFRGKIADSTTDTINLHTNNGSTGYRIVKFEVMPVDPTADEAENVVKIFTIPQTTESVTIDFSDNTLLAASFIEGHGSTIYLTRTTTIFDNMTFNQDIYVSNKSPQAKAVNYYIELEAMPLALDENTAATLKDIKNIEGNNLILD